MTTKIGLNQYELKQMEDLLTKSNSLQLVHLKTLINVKINEQKEFNCYFDGCDGVLYG